MSIMDKFLYFKYICKSNCFQNIFGDPIIFQRKQTLTLQIFPQKVISIFGLIWFNDKTNAISLFRQITRSWQPNHQSLVIYEYFFSEILFIFFNSFEKINIDWLVKKFTLDSGINIGVRLLIFEKFWRQKKIKNDRNA